MTGLFFGYGRSSVLNFELKHPLFYPRHKRFAELFADRDLLAADKDMVIADGVEADDVDDIGIVDAGEGGGELFFDVFEAAIDQEFLGWGDQANIFFFTFEI